MTRSIKLTVILGLLVLSAGCYDYKQVNNFLKKYEGPICGEEYRMYPPDIIMVNSLNVPEISLIQQQIRPDGKINLPLIGEVSVAGKTAEEAEDEINKLSSKYYAQVDSTIRIVAYNSQNYFVFGQVALPGPMPWTGRNSLLDALARAQPNQLAWPERIIVVRGSNPQIGGQEGKTKSFKYKRSGIHPDKQIPDAKKMTINLWAMVKTGDMTNNILLQPDDVIYVQPNPLAKIGLAIQTLLFPVSSTTQAISAPAGTVNTLGG